MKKFPSLPLKQIIIVVPGTPLGKPRMTRSDKWKQRPAVVRYRAWSDHIRMCAARQCVQLPSANSIEDLSFIAFFAPPVSWSNKKRSAHNGELHRGKPDLDNIAKGVFDSLYDEDSAIASGTFKKFWNSESLIQITITYQPEPNQATLPAARAD